MNLTDLLGYAAGLMTLVTFAQKHMLRMRLGAVTANILFIAYGVMGAIYPVVLLHLALLPLNLIRLVEQRTELAKQTAALHLAHSNRHT
jgi:hypothetical protein